MLIEQLNFQAFGPFTDTCLDFSQALPGFHLIYGHNEAGKSTALRAVHGFLFGIPQLSADTFLHAGKDLRVGGRLVNGQGARSFVRRKGRKNTLLDETGEAVDELTLSPYLNGVDENLFGSLFGLNHETLRQGAAQLLQGDGALSESLFGAGVGRGSVRGLLERLGEAADQLFTAKGRGKKRINQEVSQLKEARQRVAQASTTAAAYSEQKLALDMVAQHEQAAREERDRLQAELRRLSGGLLMLPLFAKRRAAKLELQQLGNVPALPSDFTVTRQRATAALDAAAQRQSFLEAEAARLRGRLPSADEGRALLTIDIGVVDELAQRLGEVRKGHRDLPKRRAELKAAEEHVQNHLSRLGRGVTFDQIEQLRVSRQDEAKLRRLSSEKTRYDAKLAEREPKQKEARALATRRTRELSQMREWVDLRGLKRSLLRAEPELRHFRELSDLKQQENEVAATLAREVRALGFSEPRPQALLRTRVPSLDTVQRFELQATTLGEQGEELRRQRSSAAEECIAVEQQLCELQALANVPTRERLQELRGERQKLWQELGQHLSDEARARVDYEQLERCTDLCDEYADRLAREASRVAQVARLIAERDAGRARVTEIERAEQRIEEQEVRLQQQFAELVEGIADVPLRLSEMRAWLTRREHARELVEQRAHIGAQAKAIEARVLEVCSDLSDELKRVDEPERTLWETPEQLIERAHSVVESLEQSNHARSRQQALVSQSNQDAEDSLAEVQELKAEHKLWRSEWLKGLKQVGLDRDAGPEEVAAILDELTELFHRVNEVRALQRRVSGIERDAAAFEADVRAVAGPALAGVANVTAIELCERLVREHRACVERRDAQKRAEQELEERKVAIAQADAERRQAERQLNALLELARVKEVGDLVVVEQAHARSLELQSELRQLASEIVERGDGASLEELEARTVDIGAERARARISEIEPQLALLGERIDQWLREHSATEERLRNLSGGASERAEELESAAASLKHSVRRYQRLRLAEVLLAEEVERYRELNQSPVLKATNRLFPALTQGRYRSVKVGYDQRDEQILLCVRVDGREVPVSGLSDGARDQLYLSLRLASIERYLAHNPPMPLVLDDILVHFDDDRAEAALGQLGELSARTQILFFTHHRRLAELAQAAIGSERLQLHELPVAS